MGTTTAKPTMQRQIVPSKAAVVVQKHTVSKPIQSPTPGVPKSQLQKHVAQRPYVSRLKTTSSLPQNKQCTQKHHNSTIPYRWIYRGTIAFFLLATVVLKSQPAKENKPFLQTTRGLTYAEMMKDGDPLSTNDIQSEIAPARRLRRLGTGNLRGSEKMERELQAAMGESVKSESSDTFQELRDETRKLNQEGYLASDTLDRQLKIVHDDRNTTIPQRPVFRTKSTDKILVVYSGPTEMPNQALLDILSQGTVADREEQEALHNVTLVMFDVEKRRELYRLNFEHFLQFGIQCTSHDTVIVVTDVVADHYRSWIERINRACKGGHKVILGIRENKCLDMESVRRVMHDKDLVNIKDYDYFLFVNSGVTGPSPDWADDWINLFLSRLNDRVKMSGLTLNCDMSVPHIQSMAFALDRKGIELIQKSDTVFECEEVMKHYIPKQEGETDLEHLQNLVINRYETGMSKVILESGYGIAPVIRPMEFFGVENTCVGPDYEDIWLTSAMEKGFGHILELEESVFFKTSRILTTKTAKIINFNYEIDWSW